MATEAQQKANKKYDAKRAGKRARAWWGVLYEESAPENWREMIADDLVETLISPLHDRDVLPNGEQKKPHYHVLISFKNPTTRETAADTMERWGCVVQRHWPKPGEPDSFKVKDFKQAARYLCHLDQADKHRYEIQDVQTIGAIDYAALVMSATDEDAMLDEVFEAMDDYYLDSYPKGRAIRQGEPSRVEGGHLPQVQPRDCRVRQGVALRGQAAGIRGHGGACTPIIA